MFAQCTHMSDVYKCLCADVWCSTIPSWIRACTVRVSASPWGTLSHVILGCFYKLCLFFYPLYPMRPQMYSPFYAPSAPPPTSSSPFVKCQIITTVLLVKLDSLAIWNLKRKVSNKKIMTDMNINWKWRSLFFSNIDFEN